MKTLNIGILGAGRIGMVHLQNIKLRIANANIIAVADPHMSQAIEDELKSLGIPLISKNIDAVINHQEVDAFMICSPTLTHGELITKIIKANNKPIFCEKPLALDYKTTEHLLQVIKANNSFVQMGYNRRFDINFEKVRAAVANGDVGKLYLISIASFDPYPPQKAYIKNSGMMWTDMNIHDFDMMRFISSQEVEEVFAFGANLISDDLIGLDVDVTTINIKFKSGALGTIRASRKAAYGYDQRIEVLGAKGLAKIENVRSNTFRLDTKEGRQIDNPANFFMDRYLEAYHKEIKIFVESIIAHQPPVVSVEDDLQASKMAKACEISYKTGRPVKISELK